MPDTKKGRPVDGPASSDNPEPTLRELADIARRLVADLEAQRRRESAALAEGYELGFAAGADVGYRQAETDMERAWVEVAESVRGIPRQQMVNARRYPGYTRERLAALRAQARERFGLPDRAR